MASLPFYLLLLLLLIVLVVPIMFVAWWLVVAVIAPLQRRLILFRKGYHLNGRYTYEERVGGLIRSVPLETEMYDVANYYVLVPTQDAWDASAPAWARGRRDEIFQRVMETVTKEWMKLPPDWPAEGKGKYVRRA
jgi:hypothetical protein